MKHKIILLSLLCINLASCKDDVKDIITTINEDLPALEIPAKYDTTTFAANTTDIYALRTNLKGILDSLNKGRTKNNRQVATEMRALFEKGTPSLSGITNPVFKNEILDLFTKNELAYQNTQAFDPTKTPAENGNGGIFNGYLLDENGIEFKEATEKQLFSWSMYRYAEELLTKNLNQASIDKAIALFGANANFPNTNVASATVPKPDLFLARYVAQRSLAESGLYIDIKKGFIKLQAAVKAGEKYKKIQEETVTNILRNWEKGAAATAIFYLISVETNLMTTDQTKKTGLIHNFNEGIFIIKSWKGLQNKQITDAQVDELLALLYMPNNEKPALYKVTVPANDTESIAKIKSAKNRLKEIYGFSDDDMKAFAINRITVR
ncbi:MAG: hypothetical protein KA313_04475 [Pseudarcicella sp.]|nr:hypothetical protein [Pseudarcicella sp.]MBP6410334.1 hypothetical protein [Pseudarcicella sp.]